MCELHLKGKIDFEKFCEICEEEDTPLGEFFDEFIVDWDAKKMLYKYSMKGFCGRDGTVFDVSTECEVDEDEINYVLKNLI